MTTKTAPTRKHPWIVSRPKVDPDSNPDACEIVVRRAAELYGQRERERTLPDEERGTEPQPAPVSPLALCRRA